MTPYQASCGQGCGSAQLSRGSDVSLAPAMRDVLSRNPHIDVVMPPIFSLSSHGGGGMPIGISDSGPQYMAYTTSTFVDPGPRICCIYDEGGEEAKTSIECPIGTSDQDAHAQACCEAAADVGQTYVTWEYGSCPPDDKEVTGCCCCAEDVRLVSAEPRTTQDCGHVLHIKATTKWLAWGKNASSDCTLEWWERTLFTFPNAPPKLRAIRIVNNLDVQDLRIVENQPFIGDPRLFKPEQYIDYIALAQEKIAKGDSSEKYPILTAWESRERKCPSDDEVTMFEDLAVAELINLFGPTTFERNLDIQVVVRSSADPECKCTYDYMMLNLNQRVSLAQGKCISIDVDAPNGPTAYSRRET